MSRAQQSRGGTRNFSRLNNKGQFHESNIHTEGHDAELRVDDQPMSRQRQMEQYHHDSVGEYQTLSDTQHFNEKHHSQGSCNSYPYDNDSISKLLKKMYKDHANLSPINRKTLAKLFDLLNLAISPVKLIECSLYVTNKREPQKEENTPKFPNTTKVAPKAPLIKKRATGEVAVDDRNTKDVAHLSEWFQMNLRSLNHKNLNKPEVQDWLDEIERNNELAFKTIPAPSWQPHPQAYMRKKMGSGGNHVNSILSQRKQFQAQSGAGPVQGLYYQETNKKAFLQYGIGAKDMAETYDYISNIQSYNRCSTAATSNKTRKINVNTGRHSSYSNRFGPSSQMTGHVRNAIYAFQANERGLTSRGSSQFTQRRMVSTARDKHRRLKTLGDHQGATVIEDMDDTNEHIETLNQELQKSDQQSMMNNFESAEMRNQRKILERDIKFNQEMNDAIQNLKRMPGFKQKVWEKIATIHNQYEEEKGTDGIKGGEIARQRLLAKQAVQEKEANEGLESLILQTSKTSALQAINLSQLLRKKWSEEKNAYVIMSKISSEKQNRRLNFLMTENQF